MTFVDCTVYMHISLLQWSLICWSRPFALVLNLILIRPCALELARQCTRVYVCTAATRNYLSLIWILICTDITQSKMMTITHISETVFKKQILYFCKLNSLFSDYCCRLLIIQVHRRQDKYWSWTMQIQKKQLSVWVM